MTKLTNTASATAKPLRQENLFFPADNNQFSTCNYFVLLISFKKHYKVQVENTENNSWGG